MLVIYADYVCPYCLLVEQALSEAIGGRELAVTWRGFELRPAPQPTLSLEDPYLRSVWKNSVIPMAKRLGVEIKLPNFSPQPRTAKALEVLEMARDEGLDHAYSKRVLKGFFQDGVDIGDSECLIELAGSVGLDRENVRRALFSGEFRKRRNEAQFHARNELLVTAVPTVIVGEEFFCGVPPLDALGHAIDRLDGGKIHLKPGVKNRLLLH